jgi:diadenosine tetraphosphate (Ap4A) HIT family hydrolase
MNKSGTTPRRSKVFFADLHRKNMTCPICSWSPDDPEYLLVYETTFWRVVLAPNQCLVGRCVIHLKRHCGDIAETGPDELIDWLNIVTIMESALRRAFDATMFNWSCYMNLSYRENPPDPHIHWWVVPRYSHPVELGGITFEDPCFGSPYDHSMSLDVPEKVHQQIAEQLRQAIMV